MPAIYEHPSYGGRTGSQPAQQHRTAPIIESIPDPRLITLATAERSCCCIARPAVIAFMPAAPGQEKQADLLLCMHHYRASRQQLTASGAHVVDASGVLLTDRDPW
jgi:hypothetical protein